MHKLKKRSQFQKVYKEGEYNREKKLIICILRNRLPYNRIGLSINTKSAPLSIRRNRCKRLLSETYRLTEGLLKRGYDIVLISKRDISQFSLEETKKEVLKLYKKSGILA